MLDIRGLSVTYKKSVFQDAHIHFYENHIHGIVGKSGSGKTVLLRALLEQGIRCHIDYQGEDISEKKQAFVFDHVFYVDQYASYFTNMTVRQHFQFYAELRGESVSERQIQDVLNQVDLRGVQTKESPSQLSIGERKRFLIALAIYSQKDIILLDEPTSSLDCENIILLKKVIESLEGVTVILTTHDESILESCGVIYKIEDCQFTVIKDQHTDKTKPQPVINRRFKPLAYYKYKSLYQWMQQALFIVMGVFLCVQMASVIKNQYWVNEQRGNSNYSLNDTLFYMRKVQTSQSFSFFGDAVDNNNAGPLSIEERKEIENIEGVQAMYPTDEFFLQLPFPGNKDETFFVKNGDQSRTVTMKSEERIFVRIYPYYPEDRFDKNNEKVFVAENFATENNLQIGDTLILPLEVPTYQYNDSDFGYYRQISYNKVEYEVVVDGMLDKQQNNRGATNYRNIYIPYQQFQKILDQNRGKVIGGDSQRPQSGNNDGGAYEDNLYILFVKSDQIEATYEAILDKNENYQVFSRAIMTSESYQETKKFNDRETLMTAGVTIMTLFAIGVVSYFQMKSKQQEQKLLMYSGIALADIKKVCFLEISYHFLLWISLSCLNMIVVGVSMLWISIGIVVVTASVLAVLEMILVDFFLRKIR